MHGGFIVKVDGKHYNCYQLEADIDKHEVRINGTKYLVGDWETFCVIAVHDKNMEKVR